MKGTREELWGFLIQMRPKGLYQSNGGGVMRSGLETGANRIYSRTQREVWGGEVCKVQEMDPSIGKEGCCCTGKHRKDGAAREKNASSGLGPDGGELDQVFQT